MTISCMVCSNKETCIFDFYSFLAKIDSHHHQDVANESGHKYGISYFQLFSSHDRLDNIHYILIPLYVVKYIWVIVYSIMMKCVNNSRIGSGSPLIQEAI